MPPAAAKFSLDGDLFFMISLREIIKNKSPSKYYLAQSAMKRLFTQPQIVICGCHIGIYSTLCQIISHTKSYFAAEGGDLLMKQHISKYHLGCEAEKVI
ncbi:MAG: hypothetical protein RL386_1503 [Bacteroidota bacterium]